MNKESLNNPNRLDDGFGNVWYKCNLNEDCGLHIVRPASHNAGATLLKNYIMSSTLSVLDGLAMAGTSGMIIKTFAMAPIQAKIAPNVSFLNI